MLKLLRLEHSRIGMKFEGTSYVDYWERKAGVDSGAPKAVGPFQNKHDHRKLQPKNKQTPNSSQLRPLLAHPFPMQMKFDP